MSHETKPPILYHKGSGNLKKKKKAKTHTQEKRFTYQEEIIVK